MMTGKYDFVQVFTKDDIKLSGLQTQGDKDKTAYIFIHGFGSDFYTYTFYHTIAEELSSLGNLVILAQNRGTGLHTEFIKKDRSGINIGAYYEKIEDAHLDISPFVEYLINQGFQKIGLIGHSLGTIKAVRYLFEGEYKYNISELILLAPFDKNAYIERKAPGQLSKCLNKAMEMISEGKGLETIPVPDWDDYPVTYESFVSWYNQSELSKMWDFYRKDYDFSVLKQIKIPVKVILGSNDEFVTFPEFDETAKSVLETIKTNIENCQTVLIDGSDHVFTGFEEKVAQEIADLTIN